jgi:hypothetical protein
VLAEREHYTSFSFLITLQATKKNEDGQLMALSSPPHLPSNERDSTTFTTLPCCKLLLSLFICSHVANVPREGSIMSMEQRSQVQKVKRETRVNVCIGREEYIIAKENVPNGIRR